MKMYVSTIIYFINSIIISFQYIILNINFLYLNEEVDKYHEIKRAQSEYEKRITLISYFDAVKATQHVSLDNIPMPVMILNIPLPASDSRYNSSELPTGILQKHPIYKL